jgi:hypothetical protein
MERYVKLSGHFYISPYSSSKQCCFLTHSICLFRMIFRIHSNTFLNSINKSVVAVEPACFLWVMNWMFKYYSDWLHSSEVWRREGCVGTQATEVTAVHDTKRCRRLVQGTHKSYASDACKADCHLRLLSIILTRSVRRTKLSTTMWTSVSILCCYNYITVIW